MLVGSLAVGLSGCVDKFDPSLSPNTDLLVVDGIITDLPETQAIRLSRSRSNRDSTASQPLTKATVEVVVNGTALTLPESTTEPGSYEFSPNFRGRVGDRFQLRFTTAEGTRYESNTEQMLPVAPILKVYDRFNPTGIEKVTKDGATPSNDIYVDFQDPAGERNFYLWRWTLWEPQAWCASCRQGRYFLTDLGDRLTGGCVPDDRLGTFSYYDYNCFRYCWDIVYSQRVNIFADQYANGRPQSGRLVAQIPLTQTNACLVAVQQLSLSVDAYRYYKLFEDQTQNTGTLADSPPAPTTGNIRNVANSRENVVGYFSASSVSENRYYLDRRNTQGGLPDGLFFYQTGRMPNVEPPRVTGPIPVTLSIYGQGVPSAVCVKSRTRTPIVPAGWR
ncbi:hypothetical protein GCM10027190_26030 [Spirosoma areae]